MLQLYTAYLKEQAKKPPEEDKTADTDVLDLIDGSDLSVERKHRLVCAEITRTHDRLSKLTDARERLDEQLLAGSNEQEPEPAN